MLYIILLYLLRINYAIWPGDIKYEIEVREKSVVAQCKRKREDDEGNNSKNLDSTDMRKKIKTEASESPIEMLNRRNYRYFSSENSQKLLNQPAATATIRQRTATVESEEFIRRRDYVMTKLLQSRSLIALGTGDSSSKTETSSSLFYSFPAVPSPPPKPPSLMSLDPRISKYN